MHAKVRIACLLALTSFISAAGSVSAQELHPIMTPGELQIWQNFLNQRPTEPLLPQETSPVLTIFGSGCDIQFDQQTWPTTPLEEFLTGSGFSCQDPTASTGIQFFQRSYFDGAIRLVNGLVQECALWLRSGCPQGEAKDLALGHSHTWIFRRDPQCDDKVSVSSRPTGTLLARVIGEGEGQAMFEAMFNVPEANNWTRVSSGTARQETGFGASSGTVSQSTAQGSSSTPLNLQATGGLTPPGQTGGFGASVTVSGQRGNSQSSSTSTGSSSTSGQVVNQLSKRTRLSTTGDESAQDNGPDGAQISATVSAALMAAARSNPTYGPLSGVYVFLEEWSPAVRFQYENHRSLTEFSIARLVWPTP